MVLKGYLFSVLYALMCLALAFVLYKVGVSKKITRKVVHILVGFEWVLLYVFMGPTVHFLAVCLLFLFILTVAYHRNLMPMISSDSDNAPGTVYYAVAMSVMAVITLFLPDMILPFGIGVFCTSLGDGLAGLIGQSVTAAWNKRIYGNKTLIGAMVNIIACFGVALFFSLYFNMGLTCWHCLAIATLALELELFTGRGLDNITITLGTSFLAYFISGCSNASSYLAPILLTPLIIIFAYKKRALTVGGIVAAICTDIIISVSLGNFGFCILLAFFAGAIVVDKIKKTSKKTQQNEQEAVEKRGDTRDHVQVFANGAVAALCASLFLFTGKHLFVVAFVASLAEAFADTVASGIGILRGKAFDVFRMRPCKPGISGGMTLIGTFASIVAAIIIALIAFAFRALTFIEVLTVAIAAFLGAIFDSLLGSLFQVKYKCAVCGSVVEREEHCGTPTLKHSGIRVVNNDLVNFLGTLFAAAVSAFLYIFLI